MDLPLLQVVAYYTNGPPSEAIPVGIDTDEPGYRHRQAPGHLVDKAADEIREANLTRHLQNGDDAAKAPAAAPTVDPNAPEEKLGLRAPRGLEPPEGSSDACADGTKDMATLAQTTHSDEEL